MLQQLGSFAEFERNRNGNTSRLNQLVIFRRMEYPKIDSRQIDIMRVQKNAIFVITNEAKESAKRREAAKSNCGNLLGLLQDLVAMTLG